MAKRCRPRLGLVYCGERRHQRLVAELKDAVEIRRRWFPKPDRDPDNWLVDAAWYKGSYNQATEMFFCQRLSILTPDTAGIFNIRTGQWEDAYRLDASFPERSWDWKHIVNTWGYYRNMYQTYAKKHGWPAARTARDLAWLAQNLNELYE